MLRQATVLLPSSAQRMLCDRNGLSILSTFMSSVTSLPFLCTANPYERRIDVTHTHLGAQCASATFGSTLQKVIKNKINIILTLLASARDQKWHPVQTTFFPTIWHRQLPQAFFTLYPHLFSSLIPLWLAFYGWFWDFEQRNNSPWPISSPTGIWEFSFESFFFN